MNFLGATNFGLRENPNFVTKSLTELCFKGHRHKILTIDVIRTQFILSALFLPNFLWNVYGVAYIVIHTTWTSNIETSERISNYQHLEFHVVVFLMVFLFLFSTSSRLCCSTVILPCNSSFTSALYMRSANILVILFLEAVFLFSHQAVSPLLASTLGRNWVLVLAELKLVELDCNCRMATDGFSSASII